MKKIAPEVRFLFFCVALSLWLIAAWFVPHYDYLPDWFPAPDKSFMGTLKCIQPVFLCFAGVSAFFFVGIALRTTVLLKEKRIHPFQLFQKPQVFLGILLVVLSILPWALGNEIDQYLLSYGLRRYDRVIDAIETYKLEKNHYPTDIEKIVPNYLLENPGNYMKFVQHVYYSPDRRKFQDYGPYTFFIFGLDTGLATKSIDYCPETDPSCESLLQYTNVKRINHRWVLKILPGQ